MKNLILLIMVLFVINDTASSINVYAQNKQSEITAEEKKAANELADRFIRRLDETGDIGPLMKEMFVRDFIQRHLDDEKEDWTNQGTQSGQLFDTPLEFDKALIDKATANNWQQFYVASFNFFQYGVGISTNEIAKNIINNTEPDGDSIESLANNLYPNNVIKFLETNQHLRNFYKKKDQSVIIETVKDLQSVTKTFVAANELLRNGPGFSKTKLSLDSKKLMKTVKEKDFYQPNLELSDNFRFGYPQNVRIIRMNSLLRSFLITKIGGEYKIIDVDFVSD